MEIERTLEEAAAVRALCRGICCECGADPVQRCRDAQGAPLNAIHIARLIAK